MKNKINNKMKKENKMPRPPALRSPSDHLNHINEK